MIIFIILALGCAALIPLVNINYDMTEYLPADETLALPPGQFLAVRKQDGTHAFYGSNEL